MGILSVARASEEEGVLLAVDGVEAGERLQARPVDSGRELNVESSSVLTAGKWLMLRGVFGWVLSRAVASVPSRAAGATSRLLSPRSAWAKADGDWRRSGGAGAACRILTSQGRSRQRQIRGRPEKFA